MYWKLFIQIILDFYHYKNKTLIQIKIKFLMH